MKKFDITFLSKVLLLSLTIYTICASQAFGQSYNWGGTYTVTGSQQTYFDSFGTALGTSTDPNAPVFSTGYFANGFTPTLSNIANWNANFVSLATGQLDPTIPWSFGGSADVASNASDGLHPYLFIYDTLGQTGSLGGQVFLGEWNNQTLPTYGSISPAPTFDFANMTNVIVGSVDTGFAGQTPGGVMSSTGSINGSTLAVIQSQQTSNNFEAQLANITTAVPEPSSAVMIGFVGITLLLRRRRFSHP